MTVEEKINELQAQIDKLKTELKAEANRKNNIVNHGDVYYAIDSVGEISSYRNIGDNTDHKLKEFNNMFVSTCNTKQHLKWYAENVLKVQNRLMQLHEQLCPDYFPDWDSVHYIYDLHFDIDTHEWAYSVSRYAKYWNVCFTEEAARKAVDILNAEKFMME